ncbi:DUF4870 domain-containing protein [Thermodesulforhabdus norvegica]|uniref:DUF4870 domain-containing protein n=1 Tax=Thermodesulforhabdus norvegica TaxID=39841 RepID=A0A1I4UW99_9BACT|nr:DUF4870 domain-containing protein [Thermodesulforhabdus norvegica]SFM93178.1 hypothetical protein SAMN05660836_02002 [Thermodesulforhabdus norvegica]
MVRKEGDKKAIEEIGLWASLCHFSALLGVVWWLPFLDVWIPFGQIVAPLGVWLVKRKKSPYIDLAGRLALSFQTSITAICLATAFMAPPVVAFPGVWGLIFFDLFCTIRAGVAYSEGRLYRYPLPALPVFRTKALWDEVSLKHSRGNLFTP